MTAIKPRQPCTFPDAVSRIAGLLTPAGAGDVIGKGSSRIHAASNPDADNFSELNTSQALALDLAFHRATGEEGPILRAYRLQYEAAAVGEAVHVAPIVRLGSLGREFGDICKSISDAASPDSPGGEGMTRAEAFAALKEIDDMRRELDAAAADVRRSAGLEPAVPSPASDKAA